MRGRALVSSVAALALAASAGAQSLRGELRVDALGPSPYSIQPGAGATLAMGNYARLSAIAGYALESDPTLLGDRWRADLIGRATLDPFRQQRWALSFGGGLSFRRRTFLAAIIDLEGPEVGGFLPAIQMGVSGGLRAAVIARRAVKGRR